MKVCTTPTIVTLLIALGGAVAAAAQAVVDPPGTRRLPPLAAPRVTPLPDAEWTDAHKQLLARFVRDGQKPDNAFRTLLRVPELVEAVMPYTTYLSNETSISPRHRELLVMRVAWLAGSEALWSGRAPRARVYGLDDAAIRRIAEGPDAAGWERFDATLLRLADQQFRNASVTNATWKALSERYDQFNIIDAVETVNHFTALSIFYNSLGVQPEADAKDRFPDVAYRISVPAREPALTVARILPNAGRGIAVSRTFGRYPLLNQRWSPRQNFILRTPLLTPQHREMLILRMGWNCQSEYEWAKHVGSVGRAREIGLDPQRIAEGADAPAWGAFEKHILRVADELYRDSRVSDATWRGLAEQFKTEQIMAAIYSSSVYRAISMSLNAYGVQLDGPEDERLPKLPGGRSGQ